MRREYIYAIAAVGVVFAAVAGAVILTVVGTGRGPEARVAHKPPRSERKPPEARPQPGAKEKKPPVVIVEPQPQQPETPQAPPSAQQGAGPQEQPSAHPASPVEKLRQIEAGKLNVPAMVELGADWCPPCQRMKPIISSLRKQYEGRVQFVYIDVDKYPQVADEYNVRSIPVQLFFDSSGNQVYRHVGFLPEQQIQNQFASMGVGVPS